MVELMLNTSDMVGVVLMAGILALSIWAAKDQWNRAY